jgi:signal peptide peptidase SppA
MMKSQSSMGGTSTVQIRRDVRQAAADPNVAGILLNVDSPGGTVAGTDQLAREVKAAAGQKPVWSHVEDLGASAAYWIASQTQRITAESNNTQIGSIGTYQVLRDASVAAEREGVRTLVLSTGPLKGMGAFGAPITEAQAAHVQGLVDAAQETFDQAVQAGRRLSKAELADVRSGGVFPARAAKDKKLIDGVQSLGKTIDQFRAALKTGAAADYRRALDLLLAGECEIDPGTGLLVSCDRKAAGEPTPPVPKPSAAGVLPTRPRGLPTLTS